MLIKASMILAFTYVVLSASSYPYQKEMESYSAQMQDVEKTKNRSIYMRVSRNLLELEKLEKDIYLSKSNRDKYLDGLNELFLKNKSIFLANLLLDKASRYGDISSKDFVGKYLASPARYLYDLKKCRGFLFYGITEEVVSKNNTKALSVYKEGMSSCPYSKDKSVGLAIHSRYNILKY